ncbi:MAG: homoserine dehydrogenase [Firmicutes bacterium]|nr:homoserine dehydrogenase [Bacillota bacterium]
MNTQKHVIKMGLLGLGTVGTGVLQLVQNNRVDLMGKTGVEFRFTKALVRDALKERPGVEQFKKEGLEITTNPSHIVDDPDIDIVVEVLGGIPTAKSCITKALQNGKYVVTANKDLLAQHGQELFALAKRQERSIHYEASVGGGIPLISPLKNCLVANRIQSLLGIVNGTTNYILTQMTLEEKDFALALAEAQAQGFAEQEPSSDLDGRDAAFKLTILASLAFSSIVDVQEVYTESIREISVRDIMYAKQLGFVLKVLAIGEETPQGLVLRVHPTLIPEDHPLAAVHNEFNALFVTGDAVGEVMFYGRGAGSLPTASAVVADIIEVVRNIKYQVKSGSIETTYKAKPVIPIKEQKSRFYLRLKAIDRSGVFGSVATALGNEGVSLDLIIQNQREAGVAEIVLVTHTTLEERFYAALENIQKLGSIRNVSNVIRVLERG